MNEDDAGFILSLVNDPDWLRYIGDRNIHTEDDAVRYVREGPSDMYRRLGFGLYLVETKNDNVPIGICGLLKRKELDDVDVGFAFMPEYRGKGYALESTKAVIEYAQQTLHLKRLLAIVSPDNERSIRLLRKVGFRQTGQLDFASGGHEVLLFANSLTP